MSEGRAAVVQLGQLLLWNRSACFALRLLCIAGLLFSGVSAFAQVQPPEALTPEAMVALDRMEWRTLWFGTKMPPPPEPIPRIRAAIEGRTTLRLHPQQQWVRYEPMQLVEYPFLHLEMCQTPLDLSQQERFAWRDFFAAGGTLFLDACPKGPDRSKAWRAWGRALYPGTSWSPLHRGHTLSFSFYLLGKRMLLGSGGTPIFLLELDERPALLLNTAPKLGWFRFKHSPLHVDSNPPVDEVRLRLYVNLMMALLAGDYKSDQLHLPTILRRRR